MSPSIMYASKTDLDSSGQAQDRCAIGQGLCQLGLIVSCKLPTLQGLLGRCHIIQQPTSTGLARLNGLLHCCSVFLPSAPLQCLHSRDQVRSDLSCLVKPGSQLAGMPAQNSTNRLIGHKTLMKPAVGDSPNDR